MEPYGPTLYNERIDQVCVKAYGFSSNNVVILVIEANPGIENYPLILPPGLMITIPDLPAADNTVQVRPLLKLWE